MAYIKALSYYLPPTELTNVQLQDELPFVDVAKTAKSIGVAVRHVADQNTSSGDLAASAAMQLFEEYDVAPSEIDFVINVTQTPDHFLPSTACLIQNKLCLPTNVGAFDCGLGCSGYVYGLAIADSFVESGLAKNVLLLTSDTTTKLIHHEDKNRLLFGDAGSATIVSAEGFAKIGNFEKGTDGSGANSLIVQNRAGRQFSLGGG